MTKLNKLIEIIKVKDQMSFEGGQLTSIKPVPGKDRSIFNFVLDNPLPASTFVDLYIKLKDSQFNGVPMIEVRNDFKLTKNFIVAYYTTLRDKGLLKSGAHLQFIDLEDITISNNTLSIKVPNETMGKNAEEVHEEVNRFLKIAGIKITLSIHIEELNLEEKQKEFTNQILADVNSYEANKPTTEVKSKTKEKGKFAGRSKKVYRHMKVEDIEHVEDAISVEGKVFGKSSLNTKSGSVLFMFNISDGTDSIAVKKMKSPYFDEDNFKAINEGDNALVKGSVSMDNYRNELGMWADSIAVTGSSTSREDKATVKRVELHAHTKSSAMDGICNTKDLINTAANFGHKAIAITDHNVVHSFPDAQSATTNIRKSIEDFKTIYGCEFDIVEKGSNIAFRANSELIKDKEYIIFDLETTGLSANVEEIIEFGAVKYINGNIKSKKQLFIKPNKTISPMIEELTGITNDHVKNALSLEEIFDEILEYIGDGVLVAHNASFDMSFMDAACAKLNKPKLTNTVIDTLTLAQVLMDKMKSYRLGNVAKKLDINYDDAIAHRADYDADVLASVFEKLLKLLPKNEDGSEKVWMSNDLNELSSVDSEKRKRSTHVTVLVKHQAGLKSLFKLVSLASTERFNGKPKLYFDDILEYKDDLLIGTSCVNGEVFDTALMKGKDALYDIIDKYDYVEVQPPAVYKNLLTRKIVESEDDLKKIIKDIIDVALEKDKIVVATGDVHYINKDDKIYRDVYISSKGVGGVRHPLFNFRDPMAENPDQHFRTTDEMLEEFSFLGKDLAEQIVVTNTNKIADMVKYVEPIKSELYAPKIEGSEEKLVQMVWDNAKALWGEELPEIVKKRIDKELKSIITHGFAVIYYISHLLVKKSLDDGYIVGSRGSVGSSLVATLSGITEVNPMPPFYVCPNCKKSEFITDGSFSSGFDLPTKQCTSCGHKEMKRDGQDIPFETFLGFKGDKVPDIDLNFSGVYQPTAHNYTKELFGEKHVLRAGTISTVATKTAFGYTLNYFETRREEKRKAEVERVAQGCEGVKRTTGQHPGGIIIIPKEYEITDFTPYNYPADDVNADWLTTHFDFHSIHDNLLKLDILGHVDPTALKMLETLTGIKPQDVPMSDDKVISLFSSCRALGIEPEQINGETTGAIGIPEFGTQFVRQMLRDTKPKSFAELLQISGLSHGTDVWIGNAKDLIESGKKLKDTIGCRDDIMVYLMHQGIQDDIAFKIMEDVRKGKQVKEEYAEIMREHGVADWYIESCNKIKYMFPKAHAAAYVSIAWKIAYFKMYHPIEYYATFLTTRCSLFNIKVMGSAPEVILEEIKRITANWKEASNKEKELITAYEICLELLARGIKISKIDLYKSQSHEWLIDKENNTLIPPFISVDGLGDAVALKIVEARKDGEFLSIADVVKRGGVNKTQTQLLREMNVFDGMSETQQLSLF